ncbi:phospholipid/glycerol acyltransferase [Fluviicola taffensis]|uniref:Phospholipid/glycerol acyltransferase n=1 Tax=Fluviicola taffensis (strain DSM 16823 / NCIMB 13979 / RW262) TaxID=755732 RepID=F2IKB6_FLUTR|nr:phospholipid/glycerol acyltransferase [Fluviicola taffensis]AEA44019.1 phospholipid/glycerol acyltransferase [Fluviicola taffensis DSM 16823]
MRPIYFLLKISLNLSFRLFYKRIIVVNKHKEFYGSTIYVSNHSNSFMDPLVIGVLNRPIVHFMTRSDVFVWWLKPILWAAHMLPIYRQQDGANTKGKNTDVFNKVNWALRNRRNILIFGEGFTDDVPIRGLKPIKKGSVRMGFGALESIEWRKKIYISGIGISYSDRNKIGSELVLDNGAKICLNDYKEAYLESPSRIINEVTRLVEQQMQDCIIYVADPSNYSLLENVMQITRKGYNNENHDHSIPLLKRWQYAKDLGTWINQHVTDESTEIKSLQKDLDSYFNLEQKMKIQDRFVLAKKHPEFLSTSNNWLFLILVWPFALIGFFHGFIPYILAKKVTEKMMKRPVFWGSVKMMLGKLLGCIYNIPLIIFLTKRFLPHWSFGVLYFFLIPILWRLSYEFTLQIKEIALKRKMKSVDLSKFEAKRADLEKRIHELIPLA